MSIAREEVVAGTVGTVGTAAGIGMAAAGTSAATMTSAYRCFYSYLYSNLGKLHSRRFRMVY